VRDWTQVAGGNTGRDLSRLRTEAVFTLAFGSSVGAPAVVCIPVTCTHAEEGESGMGDFPLTGGCNCGSVRFEVAEPLVAASYCHCRRCQRRSGAAASPNAHPAPGTFRIVAGKDRLRIWKPEGGGEKWFCGDCGSSLFGFNPNHAEPIGIRMGTFDHDPGIRPSVRQFVADAAPWEPIPDDGLPRHAESRHHAG
jgi:hypothetical protein